jgi:hypothetical protein
LLKIAHRGNLNGKSIHENQLWYLKSAIDNGFDVEADVWLLGEKLWLGHDHAKYLLNEQSLAEIMPHTWFHCKNLEALEYFLSEHSDAKFFWHQSDNYALTSNGYIWTYPGKPVTNKSIIVDFDNSNEYDCYGVCSDVWNIQ